MSYDGDRNLLNENGITKLRYDSLEWHNYLKCLKTHGFCDVKPVRLFEDTRVSGDDRYKEIEVSDVVIADVVRALEGDKPVLTAEQKEIAQLKADIAEMKAAFKPAKKVKEEPKAEKVEEPVEEFTQKSRGRKPNKKKEN